MLSLPKWLLMGGFLAGYPVLWGLGSLVEPSQPFRLDDFLVGYAFAYTPVVGGALLVPWVLLPVIQKQAQRLTKVMIAVLASLLPAAVAIGGITCLFWGWDATPSRQLPFCLSIAAWFIPAIGALAFTAARSTGQPADESKKTNRKLVTLSCVTALLLVGVFSMPILAVAGWVTRTESPNARQVAHAREFLLINEDLEIIPLAYYVKEGTDYMVRFKFIAGTHDPTQVFDPSHVDPSMFQAKFDFQRGEARHNEEWWDISSRTLVGGRFHAADGNPIEIGYVRNDDDTLTVYVWRHE